MALTGRADGPPLLAPPNVASDLTLLAARLEALSKHLGRTVEIDGPALLGERAALARFTRHGPVSAGEATRLLPTRDAWIAVALARPDDVAAVPAWLGLNEPDAFDARAAGDPWPPVAAAVGRQPAMGVVDRAVLLGIPCSRLGEVTAGPFVSATSLGDAPRCRSLDGAVVVDLSALWAGPLCTSLLAAAGARVVKVESVHRPDGARRGASAFFDLLNTKKESVALDFTDQSGRAALHALLRRADVVVEASRPRALEQLGVDIATVAARGQLQVWVSITGYGRTEPARDRAAFGDDAAVAGGLVAWDGGVPVFCADAIADPASGVAAAVATLDRLDVGGRWLVDVAMARVAAAMAHPPASAPASWAGSVAAPRARRPVGTAPALGAHTAAVLAELADP
jgi:hypothetical protein